MYTMGCMTPGHLHGLIIEWKARKYRDPVQKLKYLRRATGTAPRFAWRRIPVARPLQLVAIFLIFFALRAQTVTETSADLPIAPPAPKHAAGPLPAVDVWLVENAGDHEVYSNGLRIENRFRTTGDPRSYVIFRQGADPENPAELRTEPAGIIFHTSESPERAAAAI